MAPTFPRCPPQISTHARQRVGERRQGLVVIDIGTGVGRNERAAVGRAIVRDLLLISMVILSACVSATEQPAPRRLSLEEQLQKDLYDRYKELRPGKYYVVTWWVREGVPTSRSGFGPPYESYAEAADVAMRFVHPDQTTRRIDVNDFPRATMFRARLLEPPEVEREFWPNIE